MAQITTVKHSQRSTTSPQISSRRVVDLHGTVNWLQCPQVRTPRNIDNLQLTPLKPFSLLLRKVGTIPIAARGGRSLILKPTIVVSTGQVGQVSMENIRQSSQRKTVRIPRTERQCDFLNEFGVNLVVDVDRDAAALKSLWQATTSLVRVKSGQHCTTW